ncbi:MAG: GxxExxY protein [Planctomycetota bacterium]
MKTGNTGKPLRHSALTSDVIGAAIDVHKALGPGFSEKLYARALQTELRARRVSFTTEQTIRVNYRDRFLGSHRLDLVVNDLLVVELKTVFEINRFHMAQILSYLKASGKRVGLILNFARGCLEIKRVVL